MLAADGRSPITRRWLASLQKAGLRVSLVSTYPCPPLPGLEAQVEIPVAFSQMAGGGIGGASVSRAGMLKRAVRRFRPLFLAGRYKLGPLSVRRSAEKFRTAVLATRPDLVHALRIPYEGMLASFGPEEIPLVVSIWGNDLTLHARGSTQMGALTRRTLQRVRGLMADARRDVRLAREWGLQEDALTLVVPGSGGLDLEAMRTGRQRVADLLVEDPGERPLVVEPRGLRPGSLRTDVFFQALPEVIRRFPEVLIACPAMQGETDPEGWVTGLGLANHVRLLPPLPQERLWDLFARAQVLVSPGAHDGTPNSLLEGLALGAFPVVGDIESLREWITPGQNGLLYPPGDPHALAEALCLALAEPDRRSAAARFNQELVRERANESRVRKDVLEFYQMILGSEVIGEPAWEAEATDARRTRKALL